VNRDWISHFVPGPVCETDATPPNIINNLITHQKWHNRSHSMTTEPASSASKQHQLGKDKE